MRIIRAGVVDSVVIFPTGILYRCPKYHGITKYCSIAKISTGICTYVIIKCVSECAYDWSKKRLHGIFHGYLYAEPWLFNGGNITLS